IVALSMWRIVVGGALSLWHHRRSKRRIGPTSGVAGSEGWVPGQVPFTVVIPAHNEERVIAKTLGALDLGRGPGVEVIVVDDGSGDLTAEIAGSFPVRVIRQPKLGKAAALNAGIAAAHGDVIVPLD